MSIWNELKRNDIQIDPPACETQNGLKSSLLYTLCMTEILAVRLPQEKMAKLKRAAEKRSVSRSEIVRQLVDEFLDDEKPGAGVGWKEHFEWLRKHGREVKGNIEDEIREMDRNRGFK